MMVTERISVKNLMKLWILMLLLSVSLFAKDASWTGKWHINWRLGVFTLQLKQSGERVTGTYEPSHGILKGKIKGKSLEAETLSENNVSNHIVLTLSENGESFFGKTGFGGWITGIRLSDDSAYNQVKVDRSSPLAAFYSFLALGNAVRGGNYEILDKALSLLEYTDAQKKLRHVVKLKLTTTFFQIIDECMVDRIDFFQKEIKQSHEVTLHQLGSDVLVPISFVEDEKDEWKIKMPETEVLDAKLKALLKARGKYEVDPNGNLKLQTPRDTMRTFYEQYDRWEEGGAKYVISTMNLSEVDPAIHEWQAPLLAYYLKSVLDRISYVIYQEIPNDPKSKKPYVHFYHNIANIVIAPYTVEGKTVWQFSPKTLATIDELYNEMENVKALVPTKEIADNRLYFKLKSTAKHISPLLLHKVKYTEIWQIILLVLIVLIALAIAWLIRYVVVYLFRRFYITKRWTEEQITLQYIRPVQLGTFALVLLYGAHQLGLSNIVFSAIKAFTHLLMVISVTWVLYNFITIIFAIMLIHAKRTATNVDEIIVSLAGSIFRILIVTAALFTIAEIFNIPYKTVLAGLGIGGLAFAIAAKDTIANFFGSAIIIADRPFKTGDRIKIGSDVGVITNVGIRSTKIRTVKDTILTVPNNMITQEMIENYSEREAMRVDTDFYFALDTPAESLDKIDREITAYLREHEEIDQNKIILTGVNDFTKRGIYFGVSFFVKASTEMAYSDIRHRIMLALGQIIRGNGIEMVMIGVEGEDKR